MIMIDEIKEKLDQLSPPNHALFKRMYSHDNLEASLHDIVDKILMEEPEKLKTMLLQINRTLEKTRKQND